MRERWSSLWHGFSPNRRKILCSLVIAFIVFWILVDLLATFFSPATNSYSPEFSQRAVRVRPLLLERGPGLSPQPFNSPKCYNLYVGGAGFGTRSRVIVGVILGILDSGCQREEEERCKHVVYVNWAVDVAVAEAELESTFGVGSRFEIRRGKVTVEVMFLKKTISAERWYVDPSVHSSCRTPDAALFDLRDPTALVPYHNCQLTDLRYAYVCGLLGKSVANATGILSPQLMTNEYLFSKKNWALWLVYYLCFRPTKEIAEELNRFLEINSWIPGVSPVYGLHVRRTDFVPHLESIGRELTPMDEFVRFIEETLQHNTNARFFLATDDQAVIRKLQSQFGVGIILSFAKPKLSHVHRYHGRTTTPIHAVADLFLLSRCKGFKGTAWSSFSTFAERLQKAFFFTAEYLDVPIQDLGWGLERRVMEVDKKERSSNSP